MYNYRRVTITTHKAQESDDCAPFCVPRCGGRTERDKCHQIYDLHVAISPVVTQARLRDIQ